MLLENFPDDDPRWNSDANWKPPFVAVAAAESSAVSLASGLEAEVQGLHQAHQRWIEQHRRTTVGVSGLAVADAAHYVAEWLRGHSPESPRDGFSAPLLLRFAVDDIKAYAVEAAAAGIAKPTSRQLGDWLWNDTATGAAIHELRTMLLNSDDSRLKLIAENFLIPGARVHASP